jgi:NAD(P)-dependent dehydrogenase (short-subunit alcohol dehydrogenase family)
MKDKVIVITGASAGIGAALATQLSAAGARVALVARTEPALLAVAAQCAGSLPIVGDVTRRADHARVVEAALAHFGHVDVWVNNAGRGITKKPSELTDDDLDEMFTVNVKSALYGVQAILPHFRARGRGHVIQVSSLLGRVPLAAFRSAYVAAKHALNGLSATLRIELAPENILVSVVHPGVVDTDFGKNSLGGGPSSGSLPGAQSADEVARVIADVIATPRADVYTRPAAQDMVARYYAAPDMGQVERDNAFFAPPPSRS